MTVISKVGNRLFNKRQIEWNNIYLGQNIAPIDSLKMNETLLKYITRNNMSALNNYAEHENVLITMNPLENDVYNGISVKISKINKNVEPSEFQIKIGEGRQAFGDFIHELHSKVSEAVKAMNK